MSVFSYTMEWGSTQYREHRYGTPVEKLGRDASDAVRIYYTPWGLRRQAGIDFLGKCVPTEVTTGGKKYLYPSRVVPHYHPEYLVKPFSGFATTDIKVPYLWASGLSHEPVFPDGSSPKMGITDSQGGAAGRFIESQMTVQYASAPFYILNDDDLETINDAATLSTFPAPGNNEASLMRYVSMKLVSSPKYQTLPTRDGLKWAWDQTGVTINAWVVLSEGDLLIKWYDVHPDLFDRPTVDALCNHCNDDWFGHPENPFGGSFPKGTLVFIAPDVEWFRRATGELYLDITYRFRYFPRGANYLFRADVMCGDGAAANLAVGGVSPLERDTGIGFYFAAKADSGGRVFDISDPQYQLPTTSNPAAGSPGSLANNLIHPFGDFQDLFRAPA